MGVGAFNMVRRDCYTAFGGHEEIAMHPIDDLMLGKLIKESGYKQICLLGKGMITVYWYKSVSDMVSGLMKNTFAIFHYRLWMSAAAIVFIICTALLPVAGMFASLGFAFGAALSSMHPSVLGGAVVSPLITIFIIARSALKTTRERGITWRGTFYSLEKLRASRPLHF